MRIRVSALYFCSQDGKFLRWQQFLYVSLMDRSGFVNSNTDSVISKSISFLIFLRGTEAVSRSW